jgi:hypothetical protein
LGVSRFGIGVLDYYSGAVGHTRRTKHLNFEAISIVRPCRTLLSANSHYLWGERSPRRG